MGCEVVYSVSVSGEIVCINRGRKIERYDGLGCKQDFGGRGEICGFSESSRYRMRRYLRETETEYRTFITITYPRDIGRQNSRASKEDLRVFIQRIRRNVEGRGGKFSAFWFLEFQASGAIHYHLFCTHGYSIEWLRCAWADCVVRRFGDDGKGSEQARLAWNAAYSAGSRIESIRSGREGVCAYAAKYAAKFDQKIVPVDFFAGGVGRFWGVCGRGKALSASTSVRDNEKAAKINEKWLRKWGSMLNDLENSGQIKDISKNIKDLPSGTSVLVVKTREKAREICRFVRSWEVLNAIIDGREHTRSMDDDEAQEAYEALSVASLVFDVWGEGEDCQLSA